MKISFCLTTFNKKELLEITLQNYFQNKKANYELIVSDGYSTDGTVAHLQALRQTGMIDVLILSEERDRGEWEGFQRTLDHVTGDFFYFLSDDDYFDFRTIDCLVDWLDKNRRVDYLVADGLDLKTNNRIEVTQYHARMKYIERELAKGQARDPMCDVFLEEGACGLGLFVKSQLIDQLELFSPKFGKRTDKGITSTLFNSRFVGASTDHRTYVSIKNEKSNSVLYNYDYRQMETLQVNAHDPDKTFLADHELFQHKFRSAQGLLDHCPDQPHGDFAIYQPYRP